MNGLYRQWSQIRILIRINVKRETGSASKGFGSRTLEDNKLISNTDLKTNMKLFREGDFL